MHSSPGFNERTEPANPHAGCLDFSPSEFDLLPSDDGLTIRSVHCAESRMAASRLLQDRYRWRGYNEVSLPPGQSVRHFPLLATRAGQALGTLTVGLDGDAGLSAEQTFPAEIAAMRLAGLRLSEFTRLALDPDLASRQVLATLFQVAYLTAARLGDADRVVMEVNPRHVAYYVRVLGARVAGSERMHAQVNAPAVLLSITFDDIRRRITRVLASADDRLSSRHTPFSLALSAEEEDAILERLSRHVCADPQRREPFFFRVAGSRLPVAATPQNA